MRRLTAIFLLVSLLMCVTPSFAFAAEESVDDSNIGLYLIKNLKITTEGVSTKSTNGEVIEVKYADLEEKIDKAAGAKGLWQPTLYIKILFGLLVVTRIFKWFRKRREAQERIVNQKSAESAMFGELKPKK